jgi:hypothetical protein
MANFAVPGTWTFDGTNGSSQSTYRVSGHTTQENYLVVFDRKVAVLQNGVYSKPSFRVRIIRSFLDSDSVPLPQKAVVDVSISWPLAAPSASVRAMISLIGTIFSDANLDEDVVDLQRIPLA